MTAHIGSLGIVGTGTVAQSIGRALHLQGAHVAFVAGRDEERIARAAALIGSSVAGVLLPALDAHADTLIIAVSDRAISPVADALALSSRPPDVALHTCGARGPDALAPLGARGVACGVLHPIQTFANPAQGTAGMRQITFGIGGDARARDMAVAIASALDGRTLTVPPGRFAEYHAAAVMAGNAMIAVVDAAVAIMGGMGVAERAALDALAPLCRSSLENAVALGPANALTGPVVRGDDATVGAHLEALARGPADIATLYRAAARHLLAVAARRGLDPDAIDRLAALLDSHAGENYGRPPGSHS